jgi:hypothetical protein
MHSSGRKKSNQAQAQSRSSDPEGHVARNDLGHLFQKDMWHRIIMEKVILENLK